MKIECISDDDGDSNWRLSQSEEGSSSDDEDSELHQGAEEEYDSEDSFECTSAATMETWEHCVDLGTKVSKRVKYQLMPLVL